MYLIITKLLYEDGQWSFPFLLFFQLFLNLNIFRYYGTCSSLPIILEPTFLKRWRTVRFLWVFIRYTRIKLDQNIKSRLKETSYFFLAAPITNFELSIKKKIYIYKQRFWPWCSHLSKLFKIGSHISSMEHCTYCRQTDIISFGVGGSLKCYVLKKKLHIYFIVL